MIGDYSFASSYREADKAIIPQDKTSRDFLYEVDQETKMDVRYYFDPCPLVNYDWHCNTITDLTVEGFIKSINTDMRENSAKKAGVNFYDLFSIKVTTKVNESAEKEGNINISFIPGPIAMKQISEPNIKVDENHTKTTFRDFFKIEIPDEDPEIVEAINKKYLDVDRFIRYNLSNNYAITMSDETAFMSFAICYYFILNIFRKLLREIGAQPDQNQVSVNFNDLIEFHVVKNENDEVNFYMRPGLNAKLLIKSDEITEDDDYDDDESI